MMLQQPETSHGQNTITQNCISISGGAPARKVGAPYIDQDRQGCRLKNISSAPARADQPMKHRADSKQARVIEMLMKPDGTTIDDIMKATDWQQHSVRGFFAGVIRKKLKLTFISEAAEGGRIYKVIRKTASAVPTGSRPDKAAA
jgi:hypothetical protein